jgi:hypothetical protein
MSWFGLGGGGEPEKPKSNAYDTSFPGESSQGDFGAPQYAPQAPQSSMGGGSFEQEVMQIQQATMMQNVVHKLTEMAFNKCVDKPGSSLSSGEKSCIKSQVGKYIEASEFVVRGLTDGGGQQ